MLLPHKKRLRQNVVLTFYFNKENNALKTPASGLLELRSDLVDDTNESTPFVFACNTIENNAAILALRT